MACKLRRISYEVLLFIAQDVWYARVNDCHKCWTEFYLNRTKTILMNDMIYTLKAYH